MKTLYIVRHAKSSWENPGLRDHERPLLQKGIRKTKKITDFLLKENVSADLIISSHAVRANETARLIAFALDYPIEEIQIEPGIYSASSESLYDLLFDLPEYCNSVMMVGHNPTFTSFANKFLDRPIDWIPTSGVVSISFNTDKWEEVALAGRETNFIAFPKDL